MVNKLDHVMMRRLKYQLLFCHQYNLKLIYSGYKSTNKKASEHLAFFVFQPIVYCNPASK